MSSLEWSENLFPSFPNYTKEMYEGNEPACKGHELISGGVADKWTFFKGSAETYNGEILNADFSIDKNTSVFIVGDTVNICKITAIYDYNYCNKENGRIWGTFREDLRKDMEFEEVEKILNKKFPNCKIWNMIQARVKELCGVE